MRSLNEISMNEFNLEATFNRLCQQAEQEDRQAMLRFRSWFKGLMDPKEDAVYTEAVEQCATGIRKKYRDHKADRKEQHRPDPDRTAQ